MIANDLTSADGPEGRPEGRAPWLMAKSFPGSCALGPFLVPVGARYRAWTASRSRAG